MKVQIEDKLFLESDELQYVIRQYTGKFTTYNKGEENESERENSKVIGYFANVTQALNKLVEMKIKQSTATNLIELVEDIKMIDKYIKSKLGEY